MARTGGARKTKTRQTKNARILQARDLFEFDGSLTNFAKMQNGLTPHYFQLA
jgi:hypothetical protein